MGNARIGRPMLPPNGPRAAASEAKAPDCVRERAHCGVRERPAQSGNARIGRPRPRTLSDWGASAGWCNRTAPDRPAVHGLAEQILEGSPRLFIPGPRVDPRRLGPDAIAVRAMPGRIDQRDVVQEGAVEGGQLFGGRLPVHRGQDGLHPQQSE